MHRVVPPAVPATRHAMPMSRSASRYLATGQAASNAGVGEAGMTTARLDRPAPRCQLPDAGNDSQRYRHGEAEAKKLIKAAERSCKSARPTPRQDEV